ncbi:hypothetical protein HanRHA438_Chr03g0131021 [Helianthus annuus]|nr:hypothetical protein HanRHA438_Chr03g0131021 [Helianthus annuus]
MIHLFLTVFVFIFLRICASPMVSCRCNAFSSIRSCFTTKTSAALPKTNPTINMPKTTNRHASRTVRVLSGITSPYPTDVIVTTVKYSASSTLFVLFPAIWCLVR